MISPADLSEPISTRGSVDFEEYLMALEMRFTQTWRSRDLSPLTECKSSILIVAWWGWDISISLSTDRTLSITSIQVVFRDFFPRREKANKSSTNTPIRLELV